MDVILGQSLKSARNFAKLALCDVTKLRNAGLPVVQGQMDLIVFPRIMTVVEKDLGTSLLP